MTGRLLGKKIRIDLSCPRCQGEGYLMDYGQMTVTRLLCPLCNGKKRVAKSGPEMTRWAMAHKAAQLIQEGRVDEAVDQLLAGWT